MVRRTRLICGSVVFGVLGRAQAAGMTCLEVPVTLTLDWTAAITSGKTAHYIEWDMEQARLQRSRVDSREESPRAFRSTKYV